MTGRTNPLLFIILTACTAGTEDSSPLDPSNDTAVDDGTESDTSVDSDTTPRTPMCDDTILIDPPFRLAGDNWNELEGRTNYEYELTAPVDEGGYIVRSCDPNPENSFQHERASGNYPYSYVYGAEIRMEVWLEAGEKVRVTESRMLDALYVMPGCEAGSQCIDASGFEVPLVAAAPYTGTYVVVVENRLESPSAEYRPYDIFVEVLPPEDCHDEVDNDDDGYVDCADPECGEQPHCDQECVAVPFVRPMMSGVEPLDTWAWTELDSTDSSCPERALPPALIFEIEAEAGEQIVATTTSWDHVQEVTFSQSCSAERVCVGTHGAGPFLQSFTVPETGTWYAVIQSQNHVAPSDVEWVVGIVRPEQCDTMEDEDLDGEASCRDSDCLHDPACGFTCPEPQRGPIHVSGINWAAENANLWNFGQQNGCLGEGGEDTIVAIEALVGETISVTSPSGGPLPRVNIVNAATEPCFGQHEESVCVYSNGNGAAYPVSEAGVYYVAMSTPGEGYSREYDWLVQVAEP